MRFCIQAQRSCRETRWGRTFDVHTDKFRVLTLSSLADKLIEWLAKDPHEKFVKDEIAKLSGDNQGEPRPDTAPSRPALAFEDEGAGAEAGHGRGADVLSKMTELENQLEQGRPVETGRQTMQNWLRPRSLRGRLVKRIIRN